MKQNLLNLIALILMLATSAAAQIKDGQTEELQSSGGTYTLTKTVVAGGGTPMQNAPENLHATAGQTSAGIKSTGGNFSLYSGFWTPDDFAPTAATAVAGGRIKTADGRGIKNVVVSIIFPSGETRTTVSTAFGYYRFADIPSGDTYIFSVAAKRYTFAVNTRVKTVTEDAQDIDFIAEPAVSPAAN